VFVVILAGQLKEHSGFTVTENEHEFVLLLESVVVQVTVVVPTAKLDPDAGIQLAVGTGAQLSVGVGVV